MNFLDEKDFDSVVNTSGTIFVLFSADWCGPCKVMTPILDSIAASESIDIFKVNINNNINLAKKFSIVSIPHLVVFKDGVQSSSKTGFKNKEDLETFVRDNI